MKRMLPSVALIWMYQGKDVLRRKSEIENFDYPSFELVEVGKNRSWSGAVRDVSDKADVCIFWVDDDKPISRTFLREMTQPLTNKNLHAVMHYWSGNAFSLPRHMLETFSLTQDNPAAVPSLLQLLLPVLDSAKPESNGRIHLAFSSTERLAPLSMDAIGFVS
jgi:hypothetical protein